MCMADLPPPPTLHVCGDGTNVRVYRMPHIELNENEAMTILLHAAHMHRQRVPREIEFPTFVSIAETCLRYRCTSPLEMQVEYQWLPQWAQMTGDQYRDGLLVISYAFGDQSLFSGMSKAAILNISNEDEILGRTQWPFLVRENIKAIRAAKLAQIQACCNNAIEEYFRPSDKQAHVRNTGTIGLTTIPRCPRGSHSCDATNLGWLMLVCNELHLLSDRRTESQDPRQHSIKELADFLREMPSAPQIHNGVCDYAPTLRRAIDEIYNSVTGLTLREVSLRSGWALSKDTGGDQYDNELVKPHERPAIENLGVRNHLNSLFFNDTICLQILSHLDDIEDLTVAAMIDRGFYGVYKRNEAVLLRNVMRAEKRRRTLSRVTPGVTRAQSNIIMGEKPPLPQSTDTIRAKSAAANYTSYGNSPKSPQNGPGYSRLSLSEMPMSAEEAQRILWPEDLETLQPTTPRPLPKMPEHNEKYLSNASIPVEEKSRIHDDHKHLRHEIDMALRPGLQ